MEQDSIQGIVESVIFRNDDTGFTVMDIESTGELITVVGNLPALSAGEEVTVWGEFVTHSTYGDQFRAIACESNLPSGAAAIKRYLAGGAIAGVGPSLADRIVKLFGDATLDVMAHDPKKLAVIKGISEKKALEIGESFKKIYGVRETLAKLAEFKLNTEESLVLYKAYAEYAPELIESNPYMLCGFPLYRDFSISDQLALERGFSTDDKRRISAGFVFVLRHNLNNGHTCIPTDKLIDTVTGFLELPRDTVEIQLYETVNDGLLGIATVNGDERIFLPEMLGRERYICDRLLFLRSIQYAEPAEADKMIDTFQLENSIEYEALQRQAIKSALAGGAVVITGGPGTGKTTTINAIITICENMGDKVALAAPTGRAAKRMSELTGRDARTIHRLLEVDYRGNTDDIRFVHDEANPLKYDVIIIDEMSMVDVTLFDSLLRGIKPSCRLVMVGDFNQLPSVGAGNLLKDIINSGVCTTVEFSRIFRQAAESLIIVNAHKIVGGDDPDLDMKEKDFFFLDIDKETGPGFISDLVGRRLPKAYKYDPLSDIQVITPSHTGEMGTNNLNECLRARINPPAENRAEARILGTLFREGDKVMQVRNNYDIEWQRDNGEKGLGVFNGDIGIIDHIERRTQTVAVLFDDRRVNYTFDKLRQLEVAYAVTVHKSQGSEFPAVVLAMAGVPRRLCYRNLLYTAVTRAKNILVIVGDRQVISAMVANDRRMLRYTGLCSFLTEGGLNA